MDLRNLVYSRSSFQKVCKIIFDFDDDQLYGDKKDFIDYRWKCTPSKMFPIYRNRPF